MSSTNRGGQRIEHDYYRTEPAEIRKFLKAWRDTDPRVGVLLDDPATRILDPSAGGNVAPVEWVMKRDKHGTPQKVMEIPITGMAYPEALGRSITTMDIREDSPAQFCRDYLNDPLPMDGPPEIIITNPPFNLAMDFLRHSLVMVAPGGYVVFLLRLNFFGSKERNPFLRGGNMPQGVFPHSKRMSFTPDGGTDSIEYGHMIWRKYSCRCSQLHEPLPYD